MPYDMEKNTIDIHLRRNDGKYTEMLENTHSMEEHRNHVVRVCIMGWTVE
jgi:hypothetical protein